MLRVRIILNWPDKLLFVRRARRLSLLAVGIVGTEEEARKTGKQLILLYFHFLGFRTPIFDNRILRENPSWSTTRGEDVGIHEITTHVREVVRFHKFISNLAITFVFLSIDI